MNVPGTQVALTFISVPIGEHCPLYYDTSEGSLNLASVNPGNSYQLYVGGKGGNGQFHDDLQDAGQQKVDDYAARHQALAAKVTQNGDSAAETYQYVDPMRFSYALVNKLNPNSYEGVCFVDVFDPTLCPKNNSKNAAMLYLAPPDGSNYPKEADFLAAIKAAATYVVGTIAGYNALAAKQGLPVIEVLRSCLFSSNIYNPARILPAKIAAAIFAGYFQELQAQDSGISELQLPYSSDKNDPLFAAIQANMTTN